MGKGWKMMNEKDFKTIKMMLDAGITPTKVRQATGRGAGTIINIRRATDFSDYQSRTSKRVQVEIPVEQETPQVEQTPAEYTVNVSGDSQDIVAELKQLNITLTRLCMAWENKPTKKGWLK